jgi:arginase
MGKTFTIAIPQWQGSASGRGSYHGSLYMAEYLKSDYIVDVYLHSITKRNEGIWYIDDIKKHLKEALEALSKSESNKVLSLGGDCSSGIGPISYINKVYNKDVLLLWLDAHANINTPDTSTTGKCNGMPLRILLGEGSSSLVNLLPSTLNTKQIVYTGLRSLDEGEKQFIVNNEIVTSPPCGKESTLLTNLIKSKGYKNVYIHLDLDVLDPSEFNAVSYPTEGGIKFNELLFTIEKLASKFNIVGFNITEYQLVGDDDKAKIKILLDLVKKVMNLS